MENFYVFSAYFDKLKGNVRCLKHLSAFFTIGLFPILLSAQLNISFGVTTPSCFSESDGFLTANVTGGTSPYSYQWSNGGDTKTISGLGAGTYGVTVTDNNNVQGVASFTLSEPDPVRGVFSLDDCSVPATLTITGQGGVGSYMYNWGSSMGSSIVITQAGKYCVTITDENLCAREECFSFTPTSNSITADVIDGQVTCYNYTDGSLTVNASGGEAPYSYQWSNGKTTKTINGLAAGTYFVTVSDDNGCNIVVSGEVLNRPLLAINVRTTNAGCGNEGGTITVEAYGGEAPYDYLWDDGSTGTMRTGLSAGRYAVTVTDKNDCSIIKEIPIISLSDLEIKCESTNETCPGEDDGTAKVTPSGGNPPYTISWSNGSNSSFISGLASGSYTVTVTDESGCSITKTIIIEGGNPLQAMLDITDITTCGGADGMIEVIVTQGDEPYTYQWSTGATTAKINDLGGGTYIVTVTDKNDCPLVLSTKLTTPPDIDITVTGTTLICPDTDLGNAFAMGVGGTQPYEYNWSNGATSQGIFNLAAGTYVVTVTDANDCEAIDSITVAEAPDLDIAIMSEDILCDTTGTGSATAFPMGGVMPYTYLWSNDSTTATIDSLLAGTYYVTITDALGCTAEDSVTIVIGNDVNIDIEVTNIDCPGELTGELTASASGGQEPYTYNWSNGMSGAELSNLAAGVYSVTVTDDHGCADSTTVEITQPDTLELVLVNVVDSVCVGEATGAAEVIVTGGTMPYSYLWSTGDTTAAVDSLGAGVYMVEVTDTNNCSAITMFEVGEYPGFTLEIDADTTVCAPDLGAAAVAINGGEAPFTIEWSNGETTQGIDGLDTGDYSVTVTDANGCVDSAAVTIIIYEPTLVIESTNISCFADSDGTAVGAAANGVEPFTYLWSNGETTQAIDGLSAGTYSLTATDANGCEVIDSVMITQPDTLLLLINKTDISCEGANDGTITVTVASGGTPDYSFEWDDGNTSDTRTDLSPGVYEVTVTDANNCEATAAVSIIEPDPLDLTMGGVDVLCNGESNGEAFVVVIGGTEPYTYQWETGEDNDTITGLTIGTYIVTVTDANECEAVDSVTITEPDELSISVVNNREACNGADDGELTVQVEGGTMPYTYEWSNTSDNDTISGLAPGDYFVTVTDANGCEAIDTGTIKELIILECLVRVIQPESSAGANDGIATVDVTGGLEPYTYEWNNGGTEATESGLSGGTYSVTVTDANGCVTECSISLTTLAGLGDYVWEDINKDGIQDDDEPAVDSVEVKLLDTLGNVLLRDTTDENGFYSFTEILPGTYKVMFCIDTAYYNFTQSNQGVNDSLDNDVLPNFNGMTDAVTITTGEYNPTIDAGIYRKPQITVEDPCICLNNATQDGNGQFSEMITIMSYPGETWTVIEVTGLFKPESPAPPGMPIPAEVGEVLEEVSPGVYEYEAILVDGIGYAAFATDGFALDTVFQQNVCEYPKINIVDAPGDSICVTDGTFTITALPNIPGELQFLINGEEVVEIDPNELGLGVFELVTRLIPFDPNECTATVVDTFEIHDGCLSRIGDFVWLDLNKNGIQDPGEEGIPGVRVIVTEVVDLNDEDPVPYADTMLTDENGLYLFTLPSGTYKVTFENPNPEELTPSPRNVGDDAKDSDGDPTMLMTELIVLGLNETNLTIDQGFSPICIQLTDPGEIGPHQMLCGPGIDPDPILSIRPATGGQGELEYLWMMSTKSPVFDAQEWEVIPGADGESYDPGPIYETTYFARCARRVGCPTFIEPDPVEIKVSDAIIADIDVSSRICVGEPITFTTNTTAFSSSVRWEFSGPVTPTEVRGKSATVTYSSFGKFEVRLYVTQNGCEASNVRTVNVLSGPPNCGGEFTFDFDVMDDREVMLNWAVAADGTPYSFDVERSADGLNYQTIATVDEPYANFNQQLQYEYLDKYPKKGRNYYKIKANDLGSGISAYSTVQEAIVYGDSKLLLVYPNPVQDVLKVELFETFQEKVKIELYSINGLLLQTFELDETSNGVDLQMDQYAKGTYILKVHFGEAIVKRFKLAHF